MVHSLGGGLVPGKLTTLLLEMSSWWVCVTEDKESKGMAFKRVCEKSTDTCFPSRTCPMVLRVLPKPHLLKVLLLQITLKLVVKPLETPNIKF